LSKLAVELGGFGKGNKKEDGDENRSVDTEEWKGKRGIYFFV
jgi:hypothetical protein